MVTKKVYPLPGEIEEVEECIHGYPLGEYCPQCERDEEGDQRYHQLKDDGHFLREEDNDSQHDETVEPPLGQEWGK